MAQLIESILAIFISVTPASADPGLCRYLGSTQASELHASFQKEVRHTFFIGLWRKLEESERPKVSWMFDTKDDAELIRNVESVQEMLSERLLRDRVDFGAWVRGRGLSEEIEISEKPENGSFILYSATRRGLNETLCASERGELSEIFLNPGF
ncbi:MAG: hypothetical protein V4692_03265 [Bdellovibrionota bacterium]